jgi:hypothetical protein
VFGITLKPYTPTEPFFGISLDGFYETVCFIDADCFRLAMNPENLRILRHACESRIDNHSARVSDTRR